jgi:hypothetical protein
LVGVGDAERMRSLSGAWIPSVAAMVAITLGSACSSSTPTPQDPNDSTPVADGGNKKPAATSASASPDDKQAGFTATDRELTHRDCQVLGGRYHDLVMSDEATKLDPKLTDSQREQGKEAIIKGAEVLGDRWTESCEGSLVGKFASEEALQCAMTSKTVAAFDVCLNGPPTPTPPKK